MTNPKKRRTNQLNDWNIRMFWRYVYPPGHRFTLPMGHYQYLHYELLSSLRQPPYTGVNCCYFSYDDDLYRTYHESGTQYGQKNPSFNCHGCRTIFECFNDTHLIIYAKYLPFYSLLWVLFGLSAGLNFTNAMLECNKYLVGKKMYVNGLISRYGFRISHIWILFL